MTTTPKKHGGRRPGAGRRRTAPDGSARKPRRLHMSDAEWERVLRAARKAGMSASEWMRRRLLEDT